MAPQPSVEVSDKIELTEKERRIFDLLLKAAQSFDPPTQILVVGGWVRDKLLGREYIDIDISMDNVKPMEFCERINTYSSSRHRIKPRSKRLGTARMSLFDMWIDFIQFRSLEDSSDDQRGRVPTAVEDAYQKDLTINSLFYDIKTSLVLDLTGKGIEDLKNGKIATPLPPKKTFLDHPVRILRAIRFAARLGFTLDEELEWAALDGDVRAAIVDGGKISKHRMGYDVDLMMASGNGVEAMKYISKLGLFWVVFSLPHDHASMVFKPSISDGCDGVCVAHMDAAHRFMQQLVGYSCIFSEEQRKVCLYAALFLPLRNTTYCYKQGGDKTGVVGYIVRDSLRLKLSDGETVVNLLDAVEKFVSLIPSILSCCEEEEEEGHPMAEVVGREGGLIIDVPPDSKLQVLLGLVVQKPKGFWRVALLLSILLLRPDSIITGPDSTTAIYYGEEQVRSFQAVERVIEKSFDLEKIWEVKPLVNDRDILNDLELPRGGPTVGQWRKILVHWQLARPSGTAYRFIDSMRQTR